MVGIVAVLAALHVGSQDARANLDDSAQCDRAAADASRESGVPLSVMRAIALAESGRSDKDGRARPWPWTVNFGGQGYWFDSNYEAQLAVAERQATGATNIDIGCFQINLRWHGDAFPDIAAMFDPARNAHHAAQFLRSLHEETGSWPEAAAAFHSRTPEHANRYRARFEELHANLTAAPEGTAQDLYRENRFPLLQAGAAGALGSLVPHQAAGAGLFGAAP